MLQGGKINRSRTLVSVEAYCM